ncbi:C39 family peptidase [Oscillochloris sp. ZM17-4]|uniref:C39 family peptidase n=1 Tax=Oscillochloris sp. ZM17-4 TaxID=2866714 RepID=UPI001C73A28B|nr:C39 family peptidase [Oscillochloris sp. ZM17-4]MBX0327343.1 C39 family peptidase [Oscillochloris sp. ZM17-4]
MRHPPRIPAPSARALSDDPGSGTGGSARACARLSLLIALLLPLLLAAPPAPTRASEPGGPLSTLSDVGFYPLVASGKTDIAVAACADVANFQLRSEQAGVFLSQIFLRAIKCPVGVSGSWRAVTGAVPGECFTIYAFATETPLAEADFMARAARYSVCVTGLGAISTPQRQTVSAPAGVIDAPASGASIQGTVTVSGWAIDAAAWGGTDIDQVQIYSGATLLGAASYGQARADVAAAYSDSRYTGAGYSYTLDTKRITNGPATLQVRYHSTVTGQWSSMSRAVTIANPVPVTPIVQPPPPPTPVTGNWKVPYYRQGDPQWSGNRIGACANTIGNVGCALTSLAMIFQFYGANQNPGTLNTCMGGDACRMHWYSSTLGTCSGNKVAFRDWPVFSSQTALYARLDQELQTRPVIMELHNSATGNSHFIVVLGGSGGNPSNYRVNDPGLRSGANNKLSDTLAFWSTYNNYGLKPYSLRLFSGTPALVSADLQAAPPPLAAPQPTAGEVVTGALDIYTIIDSTVTLELAAQSSAGTVTDMRVWTAQQPSDVWQPFSQYVQGSLDTAFYVQFRDAAGNLSATIKAGVPVALSADIQADMQKVYLPLAVR